MAISETKGQGWRAISTQWRKASDILRTSTLATFLFSSHPKGKRDREAHLNCSCHQLFLFSLSAAPCRLSSARLIPMTREITSVAAGDSALTSLVVRSMGVNWSFTAHRMTGLWTQLHPWEHRRPQLPVWRPFNDWSKTCRRSLCLLSGRIK